MRIECPGHFWMEFRDVVSFVRIDPQVEELDFPRVLVSNQVPLVGSDRVSRPRRIGVVHSDQRFFSAGKGCVRAPARRRRRNPDEATDGGDEVGQLDGVLAPTRFDSVWPPNDQGYPQRGIVEVSVVEGAGVLGHVFAVVGGDHDQGPVRQSQVVQRIQKLADLCIRRIDRLVVAIGDVAEVGVIEGTGVIRIAV